MWTKQALIKCRTLLQEDRFKSVFIILSHIEPQNKRALRDAELYWDKIKKTYKGGTLRVEEYSLELIQLREMVNQVIIAYEKLAEEAQAKKTEYEKSILAETLVAIVPDKITLEAFLAIWSGADNRSALERTYCLDLLHKSIVTWQGIAGSVSTLNKFHGKSTQYLIFWPKSDELFLNDPIVAFFSHEHGDLLQELQRGDHITVRGKLELNDETPHISLLNSHILQVHKQKK